MVAGLVVDEYAAVSWGEGEVAPGGEAALLIVYFAKVIWSEGQQWLPVG